MSHFTVAVFSNGKKTVEELLAPYQENNEGNCPKEYLEFVSETERKREEYETGGVERVCLQDGKYLHPRDEDGLKKMFTYTIFTDGKDRSAYYKSKKEFLVKNAKDPILGEVQIIFCLGERGAELREVPYKELYPTLQDYVRDYVQARWDEEKQEKANAEECAERCMDVISDCDDCFYYKGCEDCALNGTEYCDKNGSK